MNDTGSNGKKPLWSPSSVTFEPKITLGNVLTIMPMAAAAFYAWSDLRSEQATQRLQQLEHRARIEKLEARDELSAATFGAYQRDTVQALTRLETQMGILLQERRPPASQPPR
jgi:hypothetical protein